MRERRTVPADAEEQMDPASAALQRRSMVRRPEENDLPERAPPAMSGNLAGVAGAARHEPSHAVGEDGQLLDRKRPSRDEILEQRRQPPAVRRDVQAAVVMSVDRGVSEV